jgi:diguanylate cyclase (GGDEF)-like protein
MTLKNIRICIFLIIIFCFLSPQENVIGRDSDNTNPRIVTEPTESFASSEQFEHLRINQGLSNAAVLAVPLEQEGYMWFGTADGFDRYDGKKFSISPHAESDPKSIGLTNNPLWWQSTWFFGSVLLVTIAILFILEVLRIRSMRKINRKLEQHVQNRTIELSQANWQLQKETALRLEAERRLLETNTLLQERLNEITILRENLKEQASHDPLTGLFNRRFLEEDLPIELARAKRNQASTTVAMIDIDHFKIFNDNHGHKIGDLILKSLADLLLMLTRQGDIACRYGGEEFVVILPGTNSENACQWSEKVRSAFQSISGLPKDMKVPTTISIGLASYPEHGSNYQSLLDNADMALRHAKNNGRNCTVVFTPESRKEPALE